MGEQSRQDRRQSALHQGQGSPHPAGAVGLGNQVEGGNIDEGTGGQGHQHAQEFLADLVDQGVGQYRPEGVATATMEDSGTGRLRGWP